jgi:hypothetical protein
MDVKFAMHVVRLLTEAKQLLLTGEIQYPLVNAKYLLAIRNGEYDSKYIVKVSEDLILELDELAISSKLQVKPNHKKIEQLKNNIIDSWVYDFVMRGVE